MTEIEFLKAAYHLLRCLPVSDFYVSFSEDVSNIVVSAKLSGPFNVGHFKLLADSQLLVELDVMKFMLTINHPDYIPF